MFVLPILMNIKEALIRLCRCSYIRGYVKIEFQVFSSLMYDEDVYVKQSVERLSFYRAVKAATIRKTLGSILIVWRRQPRMVVVFNLTTNNANNQ